MSSTFYDLKYIRGTLEQFIRQMGYEPVLFEKGGITFPHDRSIEESCLQEVSLCDILILIVGGRYGALSQKIEEEIRGDSADKDLVVRAKSITGREYEEAKKRDIPVFTFVESGVLGELKTFQKNKKTKGIQFAHVDDQRVFELIEEIMAARRGNFVREFASADDIVTWLRDQWSGLFAEMLRQRVSARRLSELEDQISELSQVVKSLKSYSEVIMRNVASGSADAVIKEEERKRRDEFERRVEDKYFLPRFLKEEFNLNLGLREIVQRVLESASMEVLLKGLLSDDELQRFRKQWGAAGGGGPWSEYEDIRKEYLSFLKSLNS